MEIQSRASWGAVSPKSVSLFATVSGWVVHYVGATGMNVAPTLAGSQALMRNLQRDAMSREYVDFEYNFAVDPIGRIFEGRGWLVKSGANGTTDSNSHEWSVVYLGGVGTPLTAAAKEALLWLTQEGARRSGAVSTVRPHRAVVSTSCPGDEVAAFVPTLQLHLHDATVAPTPKEVKAMFDPPISLVAWCQFTHPTLGKATAGVDKKGHVYCLPANAYQGAPYGQKYWLDNGVPREARQIKANSKGGYTITASTGETYNYPA